jgi:tetratricopeptide (TPR) repeat protein
VTVARSAAVGAHLGDTSTASLLFAYLLPYAAQVVGLVGDWLGSVSYYLGLLATTLGRFAEAEAHFAAASATHIRIGAPTWLARTRLEWARMLLTRCDTGDVERAPELLEQALATARDLGLGNVERRAVALLGQLS